MLKVEASILIQTFKCYKFPSSAAASHTFWYVEFSFSLSWKCFLIFHVTSSVTHGYFEVYCLISKCLGMFHSPSVVNVKLDSFRVTTRVFCGVTCFQLLQVCLGLRHVCAVPLHMPLQGMRTAGDGRLPCERHAGSALSPRALRAQASRLLPGAPPPASSSSLRKEPQRLQLEQWAFSSFPFHLPGLPLVHCSPAAQTLRSSRLLSERRTRPYRACLPALALVFAGTSRFLILIQAPQTQSVFSCIFPLTFFHFQPICVFASRVGFFQTTYGWLSCFVWLCSVSCWGASAVHILLNCCVGLLLVIWLIISTCFLLIFFLLYCFCLPALGLVGYFFI